jgi:phospholipid-transporting ATPase
MKLLSLAHMCDVEVLKGEELFYNGPSPDEVALVEFAASQNFKCTYNSDDMLKMKAVFNNKNGGETEYKFEVLRKMEFNSDRKRMSVLLRDPNDGKIKLLIKGADSIILGRIDRNQYPEEIQEKIEWFINTASKQGLRTLLMGMKMVDDNELRVFMKDCEAAEQDIVNREAALELVYDKFERNISILGATAVEDKLQDDVPQVISSLQKAGIKIWMLTGDKLETAENIGESCKLIKQGMEVIRLSHDDDVMEFCTPENIIKNNKRVIEGKSQCVIVEAHALAIIFSHSPYKAIFLKIAKTCEAVICCRVSPG